MEELNKVKQTRTDGQLQTLVLALKVCPVCDSLTRVEADQCTICNWQGTFNTDIDLVSESLSDLLGKCPELLQTLAPTSGPTFLTRLRDVLNTEIRFRKRLDLHA